MEPAIDVMSRALQGDPGARSFLERTTTIYALDVTDTFNPKTYGCWNFIHQAMNEIERYEIANEPLTPSSLVAHARLLSTMALRVARRSPATDKAMVATCISNDPHGNITPEQKLWLLDLNFELREIVMGRIAAMAFDFSFHRSCVGRHGNSSFADHVVMDTFCAVLSANAVASGPLAIRHFSTEWIIPSSGNLPPFALASVVFHLAVESQRKLAPAGTKDTLQQLSNPIICIVLVPTLTETISGDEEVNVSSQDSDRIATKCLCALKAWCNATDLSLPQISHVCFKVGSRIIDLLSDIMYSDADQVVDALAELIELVVPLSDEKIMSEGRMNQVRHLLQVDEVDFRSKFSPEQLKLIELREMGAIVEELVSAIGLQRFRFVERQNNGEHGVCRNLARIAAAVCSTHIDVSGEGKSVEHEQGALILLSKAAAHPSVNVCAIVLPVLTKCISRMPSLGPELLPILQRRAIIPHIFTSGLISFSVPSFCDINYPEFLRFREDILRGGLLECWKANTLFFVESCASAVEEFCSSTSSVEVSLQLEAALFCIEIIGPNSMDISGSVPHSDHLSQIISALALKPQSLMLNPLTLARACRMMKKYSQWCLSTGKDAICSEICVSGFIACSRSVCISDELAESSSSAATEAAACLKEFLSERPLHYASDTSAAALRACWDAAQPTDDGIESTIGTEARLVLGAGLMKIFHVMPEEHQPRLFEELVTSSISRLVHASQYFSTMETDRFSSSRISSLSDDIMLLSGLAKEFTLATLTDEYMEENDKASTAQNAASLVMKPHVVSLIRSALPAIRIFVKNLIDDEVIVSATKTFFSDLIPLSSKSGDSSLLFDFFSVVDDLLVQSDPSFHRLSIIFHILQEVVKSLGEDIENTFTGIQSSHTISEIGLFLETKIVECVTRLNVNHGISRLTQMEQGEPPFESKKPPYRKIENRSDETMVLFLDLLTVCLNLCPTFTIHLPAERGEEREGGLLADRAVDAAAKSMSGEDVDIIKSSLRFLQCLSRLTLTQNENLGPFVIESSSRVRRSLIDAMISGACGKYDSGLLHDVAELLVSTLKCTPQGEIESHLVSALRQPCFLCGDEAKDATLSFFTTCAQQGWPIDDVSYFLDELWEIHQAEDEGSLQCSDLVARFINKYQTP